MDLGDAPFSATQFALVTSMSHRFLGALFRNRLYTCDLRPSPTFAPPFCRDASWMGIFVGSCGFHADDQIGAFTADLWVFVG